LDVATARLRLRGLLLGREAVKSLSSAKVVAETRDRLLRVRVEDRALWGRMTAAQMVRHLACAYEVALDERAVGPLKGISPVVMKFVALRTGLPWPKNMATTPELVVALEEMPEGSFAELAEGAVAKMGAVAGGGRLADSHPMFGRMSAADWMRWGYLHADHHLRQFGR
jgi:hypothetical protein